MRWVSLVPVSSYGKVAAPVTSAEGLAPTPAEREPGAVAARKPLSDQDDRGDHILRQGLHQA